MNKCRRNAARRRRAQSDQSGPVKLRLRRYSSDRAMRLIEVIEVLSDGDRVYEGS